MRPIGHVLRLGTAVVVLAVILERVGTGPFVDGVTRLTPSALAVAVMVTVLTTACCAARWCWTARRLGLELDPGAALAAYYRSLLLNQTLPGGILGDVHRAVRQGALRAVAWERVIGQVALLSASGAALLVLPSPVPRGFVVLVGAALAVLGIVLARWVPRALVTTALWQPVALSLLAVAGHLLVMLTALWVVAPDVGIARALPLLVGVLVASSLPTSLAGWGPREGAAAALFGLGGLGAGVGVTVAATYGVLSLVAALPGALLLVADARPRRAAREPVRSR
jgi:glycosyltransferase 2 family protein